MLPRIKKRKIGVVIQARMTSKRFPGKSMQLLYGKPIVHHVIEKAKQIRGEKGLQPEIVVLACPDTEASEPLVEAAAKLGIENFCGSELNVLDRYYHAAVHFKLDIVIRITADCPMVNPRSSSEVLQLLLWRKLDYASNSWPQRTYPKGYDTEVFTFDCLEAAYKLAETDEEKEHVTIWMQNNAKQLKTGCVAQKKNKSFVNLCVDTPEDLMRLEVMGLDVMQPIRVSV